MRVLWLDSDEVFMHGFVQVAPDDWEIRCIVADSVLRTDEGGGDWDVRVLGLGCSDVRSSLQYLAQAGRSDQPLLAVLSQELGYWLPELSGQGFSGFVLRSAPSEALLTAMLDVAAGQRVVDERLAGWLHGEVPSVWGRFGLTVQQAKVASTLVTQGSRRLVADELFISENTVKYHLRAIYRKTGASGADELRRVMGRGRVNRLSAEGEIA